MRLARHPVQVVSVGLSIAKPNQGEECPSLLGFANCAQPNLRIAAEARALEEGWAIGREDIASARCFASRMKWRSAAWRL